MNFKFFKHAKPENTDNLEKIESPLEINNKIKQEEEISLPPEDFASALKNLSQILTVKEELKSSLKPDEIEQITGMSLENLHEFLKGEKIEIKTDGEELIKTLQSAIEATDGQADQNLMQKIASNKTARAAFIALILFAKFSPQAHGTETKLMDKKITSTENTFKSMAPSSDTYVPDENEFDKLSDAKELEAVIENNDKFFSLELANYFDTNSSHIIIDSQEKISQSFVNFLSQITTTTAQKIIKADFELIGSSDEQVKLGGNEKLTEARLMSVENFLTSIISNYKFENIPEELAKQLNSKTFIRTIYNSKNGPEKGVKYLNDLVNSDTGQNFTVDEITKIKKNNPAKIIELLSECRKINFEVVAEKNSFLKKINTFSGEIEIQIDASGSMKNSLEYVKNVFAEQNFGKKIGIRTFNSNLNDIKYYKNSEEVTSAISDIKNNELKNVNSDERVVKFALDGFKKFPINKDGKENIILSITDESFQQISLAQLDELKAQEKNLNKVIFYYCNDANKTVREISIGDLRGGLIKEISQKINPKELIKIGENEISNLELSKNEIKKGTAPSKIDNENLQKINDNIISIKNEIKDYKIIQANYLRESNRGFEITPNNSVVTGLFHRFLQTTYYNQAYDVQGDTLGKVIDKLPLKK